MDYTVRHTLRGACYEVSAKEHETPGQAIETIIKPGFMCIKRHTYVHTPLWDMHISRMSL